MHSNRDRNNEDDDDVTQCTTDVMNTIALVLSFPARRYPYSKKNIKIFKNSNSGDSQDFL